MVIHLYKEYYFKIFPKRKNVLTLLLNRIRINFDPIEGAEDVIVCINAAISFYRLQEEKYGSTTSINSNFSR